MKPRVVSPVLVGLLLMACATVPITGRTQLRFVTSDEVAAAAAPQMARLVGEWRQRGLVSSADDSPAMRRQIEIVRRVSWNIVAAAGIESRGAWGTTLVNVREANAFVTPDGQIVVFRGILPIAKSEAGLAAIIGHEVGHLVAEHAAERLSQAILAQATVQVADLALGIAGVQYGPVVLAAMGLGARYGFLLPFKRFHEIEADHLGLFFMAKAGYDPAEAVAVWERMERAAPSGPWEFGRTHPSHATRIAEIRSHLGDVQPYFENRGLPLPKTLEEARKVRQERDRLLAAAPIAVPPSYPVGYTLRFDAGILFPSFTYRLASQEPCRWGMCNRFVSSLGPSHLYTPEFAAVDIREGATTIHFDPPLQLIRWPLRLGDSWSHLVTLTIPSRELKGTVLFTGRVVAYGPVSVKAGVFLAYHVQTTLGGNPFREFWYSPQARALVRVTEYLPGRSVTMELTGYDKTAEPSTPFRGE